MIKQFIPVTALLLGISLTVSAQTNEPAKTKQNQKNLENEFYAGYGIGSIYNFNIANGRTFPAPGSSSTSTTNSNIQSWGTVFLGYNRKLSKIITVGFLVSYLNCTYTSKQNYIVYPQNTYYDEDLINGLTLLRLNYFNKPGLSFYSGLGLGVTVDFYSSRPAGGESDFSKKLKVAGQLTFLGVRFGRALGGFLEVGVGTNSIISAGVSYKFHDS